MMQAWLPFVTALGLTVLLVGLVLGWLKKRQILDLPNERSSHSLPTPRGGGLGMVPAIGVAWLLSGIGHWELLGLAIALCAFSWIDDARGLSPQTRLMAQLAACAWVALDQPLPWPISSWILLPLTILALGWFVNLYNFMDGIDGITGVETASIGIGIALIQWMTAGDAELLSAALVVAGAGVGFLVWNWHPARIFMGDSGSVPLGLLLGGLLLALAAQGYWAAALILPAYYGADATLTLGRRLLAGEKVWQAHRKHFYQRATRGTANGPHTHADVTKSILLGNLALIGAAVLSIRVDPWMGLALAAVVTAALLAWLGRWAKGAPQ